MHRAILAFLGLVLAVLACTPSAFAAKRVALVIGIDRYDNLPVLQKAVNDKKAVAAALAELGFDVIAGENLTRREMIHQPRMSGFGTKQTYIAEPTRSAQERMADIPSCNVSPFGKQRM
jgi:hypothetical protein